ncbi:hypothetical protein BJV82DRAFT_315316 [Fennellomyces sp. T-0311]|nr:hypothetical protein BJV82DRAFT_315316 [Fennellomyces sp. T-0311]
MGDGFRAEMLLLETFHRYSCADKTKSSFDHHKGTFGMLSVVKFLADQYPMACFENVAKSKLYFLHVYRHEMRLWSLHTPRADVYIMKREWSAVIPAHFGRRDEELIPFTKCFWDICIKLKKTATRIEKMKCEYKFKAKEYRHMTYPSADLSSTIVNPKIERLKEGCHSTGKRDQLPRSSPAI